MPYPIEISDEVMGAVLDRMDDLNSKQTASQFVNSWLRSTLGIHEPIDESDHRRG
jgi:Arc/MetJ family transcription regulator